MSICRLRMISVNFGPHSTFSGDFRKKYETTGSSCPFLEILYRMIVVQYVEALKFLPSFGVGSSSGSHTLRLSVDANVFSAKTVGALKY